LSEPFKRHPNPHVIAWLRSVDQASLYTPSVVIGEMRKGVEKMPESVRREMLEKWLADYLRFYADNIVAFDAEVAMPWGKLVGKLQLDGMSPPVIDSQIAATAIHHGMTLVTRNVRDMQATGVEVLNPFPT
jgi:predicted nucleic acid-binding protein